MLGCQSPLRGLFLKALPPEIHFCTLAAPADQLVLPSALIQQQRWLAQQAQKLCGRQNYFEKWQHFLPQTTI